MATIRYQLTKQEVMCVLLKHRRFPHHLVLFRVFFGLVGVALLFSCYSLSTQNARILLPLGIFMVVYSLGMLIWLPIYSRRTVAKAVQDEPMHTAPVELTFHENGLAVSLPNLNAELAWACFKRLSQDEHYFYLHYADRQSVEPLPKSAFNADGLAAFLRCSQSLQQA